MAKRQTYTREDGRIAYRPALYTPTHNGFSREITFADADELAWWEDETPASVKTAELIELMGQLSQPARAAVQGDLFREAA